MAALLGQDWGLWVVEGAFLAAIVGTVIGYYTRAGSEIGEHPVDARGESPGAKGPATVSGGGRGPETLAGKRTSARGTR